MTIKNDDSTKVVFDKNALYSYRDLVKKGAEILAENDVPDADWDSQCLMSFVTGMTRSEYFMKQRDIIAEAEQSKFLELIDRRSRRIPLQHITGEQEFMGIDFIVNEHVLVPRQDTECLVETVLPFVKGKKVLDMCTGSGCIAISVDLLGEPESCTAADLSDEALKVAKLNADRNNSGVVFIKSDLFENITGKYDVIISNPPYIRPEVIEGLMPEVKEHEPRMALDGGADGLDFYRKISEKSREYLSENGRIFFEIGHDQGRDVREILEKNGFSDVVVKKDYAGNDRVVMGML